MVKITWANLTHLLIAVVLLVVSATFLPSSLLIQPQSITIVGDDLHFVRTVTWPTKGHWFREYERLSPPPLTRSLDCDGGGDAWYEYRGLDAIIVKHGCAFEGPADSEWLVRSCWEAEFFLGVKMRPTCLTSTFFPHVRKALAEQQRLIEDVDELRSLVVPEEIVE